MIWHIFRKDWRLHWKFAALLAIVQFVNALVVVKLGPFMDNRGLRSLLPLLILVTLVGIPFLVAAVVHGDAIPGERQDWLVRPVRRGNLMAAKFLFVVLAVHLPMLLADLFRSLGSGFGFGESLGAAAAHGLFALLCFSIPIFAFVSLTKNFMEAIVAGLLVFVMLVGVLFLVDQTTSRMVLLSASGLSWIPQALQATVGLAGAAVILSVQYFRRRTLAARGVGVAAVLLAALAMFLPWNTGFAVEQRLSIEPGGAAAITVAPLPKLPKDNNSIHDVSPDFVRLNLPLKFGALPAGSVLLADRAELRLRRGNVAPVRVDFGQIYPLRSTDADRPVGLSMAISGDIYRPLQDRQGDLEAGLWMTMYRKTTTYTIPALGGRARLGGLGWCQTSVNASESGVRLGCTPLEELPSCVSIELRHVPSGRSNGSWLHCEPDYTPYFDQLFIMPPNFWTAAFRDLTGQVKYNVDGSQLGEAQIVIELYQPVDHFSRTVVFASTRLRDWLPQ